MRCCHVVTDRLQYAIAVKVWHHNVTYDQIRLYLSSNFDTYNATCCTIGFITLIVEQFPQRFTKNIFIINDQHFCHAFPKFSSAYDDHF